MSWSAEFVPYWEARNGQSDKTITKFKLEFDPQSITGVDYYKKEPQLCKLTFFNDSWFDDNMRTFNQGIMNSIDNDLYAMWWSYVLRLKYNGNIQYIGYLKRGNYHFNKKTNKVEVTFGDIWYIFDYWSTTQTVTGNPNVQLFNSNLQATMNAFEDSASPAFDTAILYFYDYQGGVPVEDMEIYNKDNDEDLISVDKHAGLTVDNWEWQPINPYILPTNNNEWTTSHATSVMLITATGNTKFIMMRYDQIFYPVGDADYVEQYIWIKEIVLDGNDVVLTSDLNSYYDQRSFESFDDAEAFVASKYLYNLKYVDEGFPTVPVLNIANGDDSYEFTLYSNTILYTGIMNFYKIITNPDMTISNQQFIQLLMYLNNLTIMTLRTGTMKVINKIPDANNIAVEILDNDVADFDPKGLLGEKPDFAGMTDFIVSEDTDIIPNALNTYYADLMNTITENVDMVIVNSQDYNLQLLDTIEVYGDRYFINSIKFDNNRWKYNIKAWRK